MKLLLHFLGGWLFALGSLFLIFYWMDIADGRDYYSFLILAGIMAAFGGGWYSISVFYKEKKKK